MRKMFYAILVLFVIGIVSTSIIIILSPDIIPAHYNSAGEVDRFGSKYENLIFPAMQLISILLCFLPFVYLKKKNAPEIEQQVLLGVCIFIQILFIILGLFFGIAAINYYENKNGFNSDNIYKFMNIATGIILVVFGNIMPKVRKNSMFGLRTSWSMKNDRVWQKSQRFSGFSAVGVGFLLIILAMIVPGEWNFVVMMLALVLWATVSVIASYRYYRSDLESHKSAAE